MQEVTNEIAYLLMLRYRNNGKPIENVRFLYVDFSSIDTINGLCFTNCEFHYCKFSDISYCEFTKCYFTPNTEFKDAPKIQTGAKFKECNLEEFNFGGLKLDSFKFKDCNLVNANFAQSQLQSINFSGCDMQLIDFTQTIIGNLSFLSCNLEGFAIDENNDHNGSYFINNNLSFGRILNATITKESLSKKMNNTHRLELVA